MKNKIIWAIDPNDHDDGAFVNTALFLKRVSRELKADVLPVSVLSYGSFGMPLDYFVPPMLKDFKFGIQKKLDEKLKVWAGKGLAKPHIIIDEVGSAYRSAQALSNYAKRKKALFIFTSTHGRKGLPRFWLGSFVENLIMTSQVPVFSLNPRTKVNLNFSNVLFPTDLSASSKKALFGFLPLAKALGSKVTLSHCFREFELGQALAPEGVSETVWGRYREELERVRAKKLKDLESLRKSVEDKGIRCRVDVIEDKGNLARNILDSLDDSGAGLVALASTSGRFENLVTGGIARQLARYSPCPVWVSHIRS